MKSRLTGIAVFLIPALVLSAEAEGYLSPSEVVAAPNGKTLYVSGQTAARIAVFDIASDKVVRRIELGAAPGGIAVSADGATLYAAAGSLAGEVVVIDVASGRITARIAVGHTPMAPVLGRDGKTLYVCNRFNNDISVIDLAARKERAGSQRARAVAAALTPDGSTLVVANLLPLGPPTSRWSRRLSA
jgi:DNA-binding beta-propeller fold protein YncE